MARFLLAHLCCISALAIKVHVVPHTHDDVGWLKTLDEYFYGLNQTLFPACVKCILDAVTDSLAEHPHRKFTYVEQAFFQKWFRNLTSHRQDSVRSLVANGQLTFVNG